MIIKIKLTVDGGISLELFFKKRILKNLALRKTPVLESLFNKVPGLQPETSLKRDYSAGVFL